VLRGTSAFLILLLAAGSVTAQVTPLTPVVTADDTTFDITTGEAVLRGHPRIAYGPTLLLADELRYNQAGTLVIASGHFSITSGAERLLAAGGTYNLATGFFTLTDVRAGEPPLYVTAATATGTRARMTLTNAVVTYNEPGPFAPTLSADQIIYEPGRRIMGEHGHLGLGDYSLFALPKFDRPFDQPFIPYFTMRVGYQHNLGAYVDFGLHVPVWPGINLGADLGEYTARGVMFGPSGSYQFKSDGGETTGDFRSGFINDHGDKKTDLLGRPVPEERGYFEWRHQQTIDDRLTLTGQFSWWRDSEVVRDFRSSWFYPVQQPDSFLEGVYAGNNYYLDLFTRLAPNNFEIVQQRLPEIRFDLLPVPIGGGFHERFNSSYAVLQEDPLLTGSTLRSDRFDTFYAVDRPITPTEWLTITPVAGGRLTYYAKATGGRDTYTRWLGEVGADAELHASGVFDLRNELWKIDGLRHLLTPKLSYRYIPEADKGQSFIPQIDREVFATSLEPLDLGSIRNLDQLHGTNTLRFGLDNVLQTREANYGSRDLLTLNLAADLNFSTQPAQRRWSDVYTGLSLTPASWLRFEFFQRLSPQHLNLKEFNTGLELLDRDWWTLRLSSNYLQDQIDQYFLEYDRRLNEVWKGFARLRYDARSIRWDELSFGLRQNLRNTWNVRYEVSWYQGNLREGSFGLRVVVDLIRF
jgi:LPS-assembly protein